MSDGVWVDSLGFDGRLFCLCLSAVLASDVSDAEASDGIAIGVEEDLLKGWLPWGALQEVSLKDRDGFGPERKGEFLVALAVEFDLCQGFQAQIAKLKGYNLAGTYTNIVHEQKQRLIAGPGTRVDIKSIEYGLHLYVFEIVDGFMFVAF